MKKPLYFVGLLASITNSVSVIIVWAAFVVAAVAALMASVLYFQRLEDTWPLSLSIITTLSILAGLALAYSAILRHDNREERWMRYHLLASSKQLLQAIMLFLVSAIIKYSLLKILESPSASNALPAWLSAWIFIVMYAANMFGTGTGLFALALIQYSVFPIANINALGRHKEFKENVAADVEHEHFLRLISPLVESISKFGVVIERFLPVDRDYCLNLIQDVNPISEGLARLLNAKGRDGAHLTSSEIRQQCKELELLTSRMRELETRSDEFQLLSTINSNSGSRE